MRLRMRLTGAEASTLFTRTLAGVRQCSDEMDRLGRLAPDVRDYVYGPCTLEGVRGVRDDMLDLLADAADALSTAYLTEGNTHGTKQIL